MTTIKRFLTLFLIASLSFCAWGETKSFAPSDFSGQGTSGTGSAVSATKNPITVSSNKGYGTTQFRVYSGGKLTISSSAGNITAIALSLSSGYTGGLSTSYTGLSTTSWEVTTSAQARITAITVTYEESTGTDPTITFNDGNYTIGGSALNLSSLFSSNSSGTVTYTVKNANGTGASISGTSFTATTAGTCTVQAAQAASSPYNAKTVTATITVTNAPINVTLNRNGATEVINNVSVGTALDDIDGEGAQGGCDAWTFVGWSKSQRAAQNNSTPMDIVTIVDNAGPYYAVYRNGDGASVVFNPATD